MNLDIKFDETHYRSMQQFAREFPREAPKGIADALNRGADKGLAIARKFIARDMKIKQKDLTTPHRFGARGRESTGKALRVHGANPGALRAIIWISGRRIPVAFFRAKQKVRRGKPAGVTWRMGARGKTYAKDAFYGRGRRGGRGTSGGVAELGSSGHVGVFRRVGQRRLPIYELKGPSIPHVAEKQPEIGAAIAPGGEVSLTIQKRLDHHILRAMKKYAKAQGKL